MHTVDMLHVQSQVSCELDHLKILNLQIFGCKSTCEWINASATLNIKLNSAS